jgi:hypothetical protein
MSARDAKIRSYGQLIYGSWRRQAPAPVSDGNRTPTAEYDIEALALTLEAIDIAAQARHVPSVRVLARHGLKLIAHLASLQEQRRESPASPSATEKAVAATLLIAANLGRHASSSH